MVDAVVDAIVDAIVNTMVDAMVETMVEGIQRLAKKCYVPLPKHGFTRRFACIFCQHRL